jgi:hypothetical protein
MGGRRTNTCFQKDDEAWRDRLTGGGKATRLMYDKRLPKKPTSLGAMLCCDVNLQEACVCVCFAGVWLWLARSLAPQTDHVTFGTPFLPSSV